jgi:hypothetical protein
MQPFITALSALLPFIYKNGAKLRKKAGKEMQA